LATLRSFYRGARPAHEFKVSEAENRSGPVLVLDAPVRAKRPQRNPIVLAEEWQERIVAGEVRSQADLARKLGVSRARVTQALTLLSLAVDVKDKVRALGDPLMARSVSEKTLRGLVSFAVDEQREAIRRLLE
jgi:ParB-like chromosome segregation protein Spo0J